MNAMHTKSTCLYERIRRALQAGRYLPGQRIEPGMVAREFKTSGTPVRFALYRLVGEGLIADHARGGLFVPLPSEMALRDRYDWMERLLLMACDIGEDGDAGLELPEPGAPSTPLPPDSDLPKATWQLFDAIAEDTGHRSLHLAVRRANDQLAPIRRAKEGLIHDAYGELVQLHELWERRRFAVLKARIHDFHERRKGLVPNIVALLIERSEQLH